jgi:hypothetical protein
MTIFKGGDSVHMTDYQQILLKNLRFFKKWVWQPQSEYFVILIVIVKGFLYFLNIVKGG